MASSSKQPVSATTSKTPGGGKGTLERVVIEPANNGFIVTESRAQERKKGAPYDYHEPEKYAFTTAKEALDYVQKCLSGKEPGEKGE